MARTKDPAVRFSGTESTIFAQRCSTVWAGAPMASAVTAEVGVREGYAGFRRGLEVGNPINVALSGHSRHNAVDDSLGALLARAVG
ncbi:hypothetical protein, partial [Nonomuraea lactucae]|uniref:hypothetical protein n=1 Tax=Nonomuraea lactucae TaxID=2249762 RepID=UPI001963BA47